MHALTRDPSTPADDLRAPLRRYFGFDEFRPGQEEVVRRAVAGRDTLAIMPTGAGKSLCYQLAAMLRPTPTLVISPLIALMKDQVDGLPGDVAAHATFINSSLDAEELGRRLRAAADGQYRLLYVAPERLRQRQFADALRPLRIGLLVIDEVHCVSFWGHDFRPDYLFLRRALETLGDPAVLGMTATATVETERDIAAALGREPDVVRASVVRANLRYEVVEVEGERARRRVALRRVSSLRGTGIIYARARMQCERLADDLRAEGVEAAFYHAGLDMEDRSRIQEDFLRGTTRVIVATVAFGMGIDKPDIRWIILYNHPKSLEEYVQMVGRAGRDGLPSTCILYASDGDAASLRKFATSSIPTIDKLRAVYRVLRSRAPDGFAVAAPDELTSEAGLDAEEDDPRVFVGMLERAGLVRRDFDVGRSMSITLLPAPADTRARIDDILDRYRRGAESHADGMVRFAQTRTCRHLQIARHFGEAIETPCGKCDVCDGTTNVLEHDRPLRPLPGDVARAILDAVEALPRPVGVASLVATLRGTPDAPPTARRSPAFGALESGRASHVERWVRQLLDLGHLVLFEQDGYRLVRVGKRDDLPVFGHPDVRSARGRRHSREERRELKATVEGDAATAANGGRAPGTRDPGLYERLRAWRRARAQADGVPAFIVLHDRVMDAIAAYQPRTIDDLAGIEGIGPRKLERYGEDILAVIAEADS